MSMGAKADLLRGPTLKIERAKHHINDLNGQINAYLGKRPLKLMIRDDLKAARRTVYVKAHKTPPYEEFGVVLGDAVHNLRAALDVTLWAMGGDKAKRPKSVQFPFCEKAERLDDAIKSTEIETVAGKNVVAEIKRIKPYPTGNPTLYGVDALDRADKHRLIVTTTGIGALSLADVTKWTGLIVPPTPDGSAPLGVIMSVQAKFVANLGGLTRLQRRHGITTETEANPQPTFQIAFGEGEPFPAFPVIFKLNEMVESVSEVVDNLVTEYLK